MDVPPLGLIREGTVTCLLQDGERTLFLNPAGLAAPTADFIVYLTAAEKVQWTESERQFKFDVNVQLLAEYVRGQQ
ncbi:MAG: hypothetical protein JXA42_24755 [Anaerolineales bacterium]|nr:hypothetical protein [Anaerolineales bacterium]